MNETALHIAFNAWGIFALSYAIYNNFKCKRLQKDRDKYYRLWQAALADRNNAGWEVAQALEDRVAELEGLVALKNQEGIAK